MGNPGTDDPPWGNRRVALLAGLIFLSAFIVHVPRLTFPMIFYDDFGFLRESWTGSTAWSNLWVPINEHISPMPRITTWALIQLSGRASALPFVLAIQGVLVLFIAMGLLYLFLRRELGHPVYGLVGMALFGVTSQYQEVISWYAGNFSLISLIFLLLGLLAAQRWLRYGRTGSLVPSVFWTALAPSWCGIGLLAGPLCALYLLVSPRTIGIRRGWVSLLLSLTPLLGTVLFVSISLPRAYEAIVHTQHFQGKSPFQVFRVDGAILYGSRSLVDNLLLGSFGIVGLLCPLYLIPILLLLLLCAGIWWWRLATQRSLLLLGLGSIFSSYFIIYGMRAQWPYEQIAVWSRYQLWSHLGLVLFLCGGLPSRHLWLTAGRGAWSPRFNRIWITTLAVLVLIQLPRSVGYTWAIHDVAQRSQLRLVDAVDARCRQYRISAVAARAALPPLVMAGGSEIDNAWELLYGSNDPRELDAAEIVRLLLP